MAMPTKLKVGHRTFSIRAIDAKERDEFGYAETDGFEGVIYINQSLRGTKLADAIRRCTPSTTFTVSRLGATKTLRRMRSTPPQGL